MKKQIDRIVKLLAKVNQKGHPLKVTSDAPRPQGGACAIHSGK